MKLTGAKPTTVGKRISKPSRIGSCGLYCLHIPIEKFLFKPITKDDIKSYIYIYTHIYIYIDEFISNCHYQGWLSQKTCIKCAEIKSKQYSSSQWGTQPPKYRPYCWVIRIGGKKKRIEKIRSHLLNISNFLLHYYKYEATVEFYGKLTDVVLTFLSWIWIIDAVKCAETLAYWSRVLTSCP